MAKNLIIVESPAKTRTLKKFLGRDYAVEASVGHIRDLAKKNMGLGENYEPKLRRAGRRRRTWSRSCATRPTRPRPIYLAPDPDREGEAIAWHISEVLGREHQGVLAPGDLQRDHQATRC